MCSPFIGDERGVFTCSFHSRMNEIFKLKVGLIQELNVIKKSENPLIPHCKW